MVSGATLVDGTQLAPQHLGLMAGTEVHRAVMKAQEGGHIRGLVTAVSVRQFRILSRQNLQD